MKKFVFAVDFAIAETGLVEVEANDEDEARALLVQFAEQEDFEMFEIRGVQEITNVTPMMPNDNGVIH
jgi:hypothetical protein